MPSAMPKHTHIHISQPTNNDHVVYEMNTVLVGPEKGQN
jgi:hypothetical protein